MAKVKEKIIPKNIEDLLKQLDEKYGKEGGIKDFEVTPSGSIVFDKESNCGGIPQGKLIEIFGPESSGKSTFVLHQIAECQKKGGTAAILDYEHSFDSAYARKIGVNVEKIIFRQPDSMEDGYNMIVDMIKSKLVKLIVIDSHTAMNPEKRMEGEIGDTKMAPEARVNSDALKAIKPLLKPYEVTIIGISQLRTNIGAMHVSDKPTGGNAWKFYTDMRIKIYRQVEKNIETDKVTFEIIKNKCGKPFGKGEINIRWGEGFDKIGEIIDVGVELKIINKAGSWYSYNDTKLGQGRESVRELFLDNPELFEEIKKKTIDAYSKIDTEMEIPAQIAEEHVVDALTEQLKETE